MTVRRDSDIRLGFWRQNENTGSEGPPGCLRNNNNVTGSARVNDDKGELSGASGFSTRNAESSCRTRTSTLRTEPLPSRSFPNSAFARVCVCETGEHRLVPAVHEELSSFRRRSQASSHRQTPLETSRKNHSEEKPPKTYEPPNERRPSVLTGVNR